MSGQNSLMLNKLHSEQVTHDDFKVMTPKYIVAELDRYIVGQNKAKKAVAIALRNRMRRQKLAPEIREEIAPKNILMMGPTGVGKTEIARRLAKLCNAPFLKVEATKYTEVGYVGRDVESMVRDLMASGIAMVKAELKSGIEAEATLRTEERILDILLPGLDDKHKNEQDTQVGFTQSPGQDSSTREKFRVMLREGKFDDKEIEFTSQQSGPQIEVLAANQMEEMEIALGNITNMFGGKKKKRQLTIKEARPLIKGEELDKLIDMDKAVSIARTRVQETGIIFIDEIDKIASKGGGGGNPEVSREGVQRDILPIVEGSQVNSKWGTIDTTHILFIAAGAFNVAKPQDLIPELQGRFPIRVELEALGADDFERILGEPQNALIKQYKMLMEAEGVTLNFLPEAIKRLAFIAATANSTTENIGARRLHTVMERLLEDVSFNAPDIAGQTITIDSDFVDAGFKDFTDKQDLSRYIL